MKVLCSEEAQAVYMLATALLIAPAMIVLAAVS
jgi:hypothetical protein